TSMTCRGNSLTFKPRARAARCTSYPSLSSRPKELCPSSTSLVGMSGCINGLHRSSFGRIFTDFETVQPLGEGDVSGFIACGHCAFGAQHGGSCDSCGGICGPHKDCLNRTTIYVPDPPRNSGHRRSVL